MAGKLYAESFPICTGISVLVPTVGAIMEHEQSYYEAVSCILATPYDMMVQLDDAGIDFTKISDFDLFCMMFPRLQMMDTSLIFGDLDLSKFHTAIDEHSGVIFLVDPEKEICIDRVSHDLICRGLREMLLIEKTSKTPGNEEARQYLLKKERRRQQRRKNKKYESQLEKYIIALVNTEQFPYNYETVKDITILQFYASLGQIMKKIRYDNTMIGVYAGTVKFDDLKLDERTWI